MRALLRNVLLTALTVFALSAASVTVSVAAGDPTGDGEQVHSLLGSYLAANFAKNENDPDHAAAFYRDALSQDPGNEVLLEQAFQAEASEANWDRAVGL